MLYTQLRDGEGHIPASFRSAKRGRTTRLCVITCQSMWPSITVVKVVSGVDMGYVLVDDGIPVMVGESLGVGNALRPTGNRRPVQSHVHTCAHTCTRASMHTPHGHAHTHAHAHACMHNTYTTLHRQTNTCTAHTYTLHTTHIQCNAHTYTYTSMLGLYIHAVNSPHCIQTAAKKIRQWSAWQGIG